MLPRVRLGFAYLATARRRDRRRRRRPRRSSCYGKAADQFDTVQRKFGKKPNAADQRRQRPVRRAAPAWAGSIRRPPCASAWSRIRSRIDSTGSAWFNLATAYLARKQTKKARTAGTEFTRLRKTEARGYILLGDTYFADRDWAERARPVPAGREAAQAEPGPRPGPAVDPARQDLSPAAGVRATGATRTSRSRSTSCRAGCRANPGSFELALELGGAYLEARQDAKAVALTDRLLGGAEAAKLPAEAARQPARARRQGAVQPAQAARRRASGSRPRASSGRATSRSSAAWC